MVGASVMESVCRCDAGKPFARLCRPPDERPRATRPGWSAEQFFDESVDFGVAIGIDIGQAFFLFVKAFAEEAGRHRRGRKC